MNSYTHMTVGALTAGLAVAVSISQRSLGLEVNGHMIYSAAMVIPAVWGALGPDIDMPKSTSGRIVRNFLRFSMIGAGLALIVMGLVNLLSGRSLDNLLFPLIAFALCAVLMIFISFAKHRRQTHSGIVLVFMVIALINFMVSRTSSLVADIVISVLFGFVLGWASHLAADTFNRKGVPWLYPFWKKYFHVATVLTNSKQEKKFRNITILVFVIFYILIIFYGNRL